MKFVRFLFVFIFLCTSLIVPVRFGLALETKSVLVYENNQVSIESYKKAGFNVLEIYDEYFLAEINTDQEDLLMRKQVRYTEIVGIREIRFDEFIFTSDGAKNFIYPEELKSKIGPVPADRESFFILQFFGPVKSEWIDELKKEGITFYFPLQYSSFYVRSTPEKITLAKQKRFVRTIGYLPNYYKLTKELRQPGLAPNLDLNVITDINIDVQKLFTSIQYFSKDFRYSKTDTYGFLRLNSFPVSLLQGLLSYNDVTRISIIEGVSTLNAEAAQVVDIRDLNDSTFVGLNEGATQATVPPPPPVTYNPSQIVAVADTGLSTGDCTNLHPAFIDNSNCKVIAHFGYNDPYQSDPALADWSDYDVYTGNPLGHGTHVSGSVLGNGWNTPNLRHRGMASKAKVVIQSLKKPGSDTGLSIPAYSTLFGDAFNSGARIHTNSWGGNDIIRDPDDPTGLKFMRAPGYYSTDCNEIDSYLWSHPDLNVLFAAGNYGYANLRFGTDLTNQANSKNVITVGASENNSQGRNPAVMAFFSSGGYAMDGRIKPDIVAPGYSIYSTYPTGTRTSPGYSYAYAAGTSMATPVTAGSLTVIREFFTYGAGAGQINNPLPPFTLVSPTLPLSGPSSALLKAVLVNGAFNEKMYIREGATLSQIYSPNRISGWGRVDVRNAVMPESNKIKFYDIQTVNGFTTSGASHMYKYKVEDYAPLKITVAYTDYPGMPGVPLGTAKSLVNDLDLVIADPLGNLYYGNAIGQADGFSIINPPTSSIDSKNNVEVIQIKKPIVGEYKIYVNATNVSFGPQGYGLVISGGVTPYPAPPDPTPLNPQLRLAVVPGLREVLRGQEGTFQARVRSIDGASGAVTFSLSILEGSPVDLGLTYIISPLSPSLSSGGQAESVITFYTTGNTPLNDYHITISASTTTLTSNPVDVILRVIEEPYFDLTFTPAVLNIHQGESTETLVSVVAFYGFSEDVRFVIEDPEGNLPPSITFNFSPNPTSINMKYRSVLSIQTTMDTPVGEYIILVHGKNATTNRNLDVTRELKLNVQKRINVYKTQIYIKSIPEAVEEEGEIKYRIQIKNIGNEPLINNTLIFDFDPNLQFLFSEPAGNLGDGKLYVGIRDLNPGACYPASDCNAIRFPGFSDVDGDYMIVRAKLKPFATKPQPGQMILSKFTFQSDPALTETVTVQTPLRVKQAGEYPLYFKVYFEGLNADGSYPVGKELSVRFRIDGGSGRYMYTWDWSDGEVIRDHEAGTEEIVLKHTYAKAGVYRITIQARDARGRFKKGEVILRVK